jgi:hypothetical protein
VTSCTTLRNVSRTELSEIRPLIPACSFVKPRMCVTRYKVSFVIAVTKKLVQFAGACLGETGEKCSTCTVVAKIVILHSVQRSLVVGKP